MADDKTMWIATLGIVAIVGIVALFLAMKPAGGYMGSVETGGVYGNIGGRAIEFDNPLNYGDSPMEVRISRDTLNEMCNKAQDPEIRGGSGKGVYVAADGTEQECIVWYW